MRRFARAWTIVRRRGVRYVGYLVTGYLLPRLGYSLLFEVPRTYVRMGLRLGISAVGAVAVLVVAWFLGATAGVVTALVLAIAPLPAIRGIRMFEVYRMQRRASALTDDARIKHTDDSFTEWESWPVDGATRQRIEAHIQAHPDGESMVGRLDVDGRGLGLFGPLPLVTNLAEEDFVARPRFPLDIVVVDNKVLVRKDYRGDRLRFAREWHNLARLRGNANVPAVYRADPSRTLLYKNLVRGRTIRDLLVDAGARILISQTDRDAELQGLSRQARIDAVLARGTELVRSSLPESFLLQLEQQLDEVHRAGIAGLSLTFGNVMVEEGTGAPWLIDFEGARAYQSVASLSFALRRDEDRVKFNKIYARTITTESSARAKLAEEVEKVGSSYGPIDFGRGLSIGHTWSTESGTGRWEYFNRQVMPPLGGKTVLDLGSHNAVMPMMMLRAGARKVVGVEMSAEHVEAAMTIHRVFEWRDMRKYDLSVHHGNMLDILSGDWGKFDIVTAFCTLYYLDPDDMARVVRKASELAPLLVVQGNDFTRQSAADGKAEKSSTDFLKKLLQENYFPEVEVFAPRNYSRPVLVGRSRTSAVHGAGAVST